MFICNKCNKEFKTKQHYNNHLARKNPCVKQIYKCDNCGKLSESNSDFFDRDGHVCPYCQKGILHRYHIERRGIYIGNNNTFEGDLVVGNGAQITR